MSAVKIAGGLALLIPPYVGLSYILREGNEPWADSLKRSAQLMGRSLVLGVGITVAGAGVFFVLDGACSAFQTE